MNKLEEICQFKLSEINKLKKKINYKKRIQKRKKSNFLLKLIENDKKHFNVITEIKKSSPSQGIIRKKFNPLEISLEYQKAGAKCLSVLTESKYFNGDINFLPLIKKKIKLPILRKDFILDEWQVYESHYFGADCILLILAILDDSTFFKLYKLAHNLGMDVISEIHDKNELDRALNFNVKCIGINNRNLKTLKINTDTFKKLSSNIPKNIIKICESGLKENNQLKEMAKFGAHAFLVGESLMKSNNIFKSTKELIKK